MNEKPKTEAQEHIFAYLQQSNFNFDAVDIDLSNPAGVKIVDKANEAETATLTINGYCDIIHCEVMRVIAESNIPHTLEGLTQKPTKWTSVNKGLFDRYKETVPDKVMQ